MYGKFFASTFTGSMLGSGPTVFAVWGYVIANTVGSQVELNPALLSHVIGATPEEIERALNVLCAPDPKSRSKVEDGRRLIREGEYAYRVPNYEAYHAVRNEEDRRAYNREKQREHRKKVKAAVNDSQSLSALSAKEEAEERKKEKKSGAEAPPAPPADRDIKIDGEVPVIVTFPKEAQEIVRKFGAGSADRAGDMATQLLATLAAGAKLEKGVLVRAYDHEHLRWACRMVLAEPPNKPELAARFVLLKLRDTYLEMKARHEKAARATESEEREDLVAEAQRYVDGIGGLWDLIETEVDGLLEPAQRGKPSPSRNILLEAAVLDAFERKRTMGDGSAPAARRAPGASTAGPPAPPTAPWQPARVDTGAKATIPADLLEDDS